MDNTRELKSFVWHKPTGKCFFVSTVERDSSAAIQPPPLRYMETIVWEYDWNEKLPGKIIAKASEGAATEQHFEVCRQLYCSGEYSEDEVSTQTLEAHNA